MTLVLPIALILCGLSVIVAPDDPALLTIQVESQVTSERIPGASVTVGSLRYASDSAGEIRIKPVPAGTNVVASANGHETLEKHVFDEVGGEMTLSLSGVLVVGSLRDAISNESVAGAGLTVVDTAGKPVANARTDAAGNFIFKFIPEDAELLIRDDVYGESRQAIGDERTLLVLLDPPGVRGRVVDDEARPLPHVQVRGSGPSVMTDTDGRFVLDGIGQGSELEVTSDAAGSTTVVVEGRDLGDITLRGDNAEPLATPKGGDG